MSLADRSRSLSKLLGDAVEQLGALFQVELQLAQAELSENVANAGRGAAYLAVAAMFAIPVITLLLIALALWIKEATSISLALSYLISALIGAAIGLICGLIALNYLRAKNLRPNITLEQIRRDIAVAKDIGK
jgi:uncharacterized membrane protein YqjE